MSRGKGDDYKVGYGCPPQHTRFKPGHSGNPKGRPRQRRSLRGVLDDHLQQSMDVTLNGRPCRMSRIDALVRTTVDGALKGDPKAVAALMLMMRQTGAMGETTEPACETDLSAGDKAIMERFLTRQRLTKPTDAGTPPPRAKRNSKRRSGK